MRPAFIRSRTAWRASNSRVGRSSTARSPSGTPSSPLKKTTAAGRDQISRAGNGPRWRALGAKAHSAAASIASKAPLGGNRCAAARSSGAVAAARPDPRTSSASAAVMKGFRPGPSRRHRRNAQAPKRRASTPAGHILRSFPGSSLRRDECRGSGGIGCR